MSQRVMIIGLDGATHLILRPLAERGVIPNLARLMSEGVTGVLQSTIPAHSGPAWMSFALGKNPGQHGVVSFLSLETLLKYAGTGGKDSKVISWSEFAPQAFWQVASDAGKRVGVINVPVVYPPTPVNGFLITGVLTPPGTTNITYPSDLADQLDEYQIDLDFGEKVLGKGVKTGSAAEKAELYRKLESLLRTHRCNAAKLCRSKEWDLFVMIFRVTDPFQHHFWEEVIAAAQEPGLHNRAEVFFRAVDAGVGDLLEQIDSSTTVLVMSDHGFRTGPKKYFHANYWLQTLGWFHLDRTLKQGFNPKVWLSRLGVSRGQILRWGRKIVPALWLDRSRQFVKGMSTPAFHQTSRAWAIPLLGSPAFGIRINLKGRDPNGLVLPEEYTQVRDELIAAVRTACDPGTSEPIAAKIYTADELYHGPHVTHMPDVIVELAEACPCPSLLTDLATRTIVTDETETWEGIHEPEGIIIARGPGLRAGHRLNKTPRIEDVAPTALYMLGVPIPDDLDGEVIQELFDESALRDYPIRFAPRQTQVVEFVTSLSSDETDEVMERLRGLGYIE